MAHEEKARTVRSGPEDSLTGMPFLSIVDLQAEDTLAPITVPLLSLPQLTHLSSQHQAM